LQIAKQEVKSVHHDRLSPVVDNGFKNEIVPDPIDGSDIVSAESDYMSSSDSDSKYSVSTTDESVHENDQTHEETPEREQIRQERRFCYCQTKSLRDLYVFTCSVFYVCFI